MLNILCEHYKARAYINVAGKDFRALQSLMLVKLASDIHQGLVRNPRKCLNSAAGELKSRMPNVNIDSPDGEGLSIKHSVRAIPTLLVLDENDNLVRKMTGLPATPTDLTKFVYE